MTAVEMIKMTSKNLQETIPLWSEAVHAYAREKGWWDEGIEKRNVPQMLLLIKSELIEAHEEHRKADSVLTKIYFGEGSPPKPEGFPIEVADAVIRILDLVQALHSVIEAPRLKQVFMNACAVSRYVAIQGEIADNVGEALDDATDAISNARKNAYAASIAGPDAFRACLIGGLIPVVGFLFRMCDAYNINLGDAVAIKHTYNGSRPYRHGNKKA